METTISNKHKCKECTPKELKTVKFLIDNREDRERMIVALANSGYHVWVEDNADKREYSTPYIYYVCCNVEEEQKE